jgi:hypothetical protein
VHLRQLTLLQKKVIRIITGENYLAHTDPLFVQTGILKLSDLHTYLLAILMFKNKQAGDVNSVEHRYLTRSRYNIPPTFQRLSVTQRSITYSAPTAWNSLPRYLTNITSISVFKSKLKNYYLRSYQVDD